MVNTISSQTIDAPKGYESPIKEAGEAIVEFVSGALTSRAEAIVVALDGGSGSGKSTLAAIVRQSLSAAHLMLDNFYTIDVPEDTWGQLSVEQRLRDVFDWERVRNDAILPLRTGRAGRWRAFDFAPGLGYDGVYRRKRDVTEVQPAAVRSD